MRAIVTEHRFSRRSDLSRLPARNAVSEESIWWMSQSTLRRPKIECPDKLNALPGSAPVGVSDSSKAYTGILVGTEDEKKDDSS
ncbi:hypothetical protein MRX96_027834 [Rhipicephalus microplus]